MIPIDQKLYEAGIVPVIKIDDTQNALPLAEALASAGLPVMEITFRTEAAEESIRQISSEMPHIFLGAGTVLTMEQVDRAYNAGAQFIVTPGLNPRVVSRCQELGITVIPGTSTPGEMEAAMELGLDLVKFFPAEQCGGVNYLKAVSAPYPGLRFLPTGGMNEANINQYLSLPCVLACGGSWMVADRLIKNRNFGEITAQTQKAIATMLNFEFAHIAIDFSDREEAMVAANLLSSMFDFKNYLDTESISCGNSIECTMSSGIGKNGCLAISTNSLQRAVAYLRRKGARFMKETYETDNRTIKSIFLRDEIGGFAVKLINKK